MYQKWFGNIAEKMTQLINTPLKEELAQLQNLIDRYADTLETIEEESKLLEREFEVMLSELVVTE